MRNKELKDRFNVRYEKFGFFSPKDIQFVIYDKEIWDLARRLLKESKAVVDLGAGGGTLLFNISKVTKAKLTGVDFSDISVAYLKKMIPRAQIIKEDVTQTSLQNESCDFVASTMTIEHVDDNKFLKEAYRVLEKGGYLLLTTVLKGKNAWYFYKDKSGKPVLEPTHLREYDSLDVFLDLLKKNGFTILKAKIPKIKFSLIDPFLKALFGSIKNEFWNSLPGTKPLEFLRKISRINVPNYYAIEVIAQKK